MKAKNIRRRFSNSFSLSVRIVISAICIVWIANYPSHASLREVVRAAINPKVMDTSLTQFEGFYQFPNKVAYIHFERRNNSLIGRQVWDNRTYQLIRKDDLHFESEDEAYKIEFLKNSSDEIIGVKLLERAVLTKVAFDPTKVVTLSSAEITKLEGSYEFQRDSNFKLTITSEGEGIVLKQQWDGKSIFFLPRSETTFLSEDLSFPLTFVLEGDKVKQVTCFTNDVWNKLK